MSRARVPSLARRLDETRAEYMSFIMKSIAPPSTNRHPDRFLLLQEAMADGVSELAVSAIDAGWRPEEVAAALVELADHLMLGVIANRNFDRDLGHLRRT